MDAMVSLSCSIEVGPTEDVVQVLLDFLIEPILPSRSSGRKAPSLSQQEMVAKQMHAVVLLFNYYQRKRHPEIEILRFESFCKLAVVLKPALLAYMKLMHQTNYTELEDLENQLSLTEKTIMDACDISATLDPSKEFPNTEGWPISKVAVLLIDANRENCLLLFSSITHGVWSVIEKDVNVSDIGSGFTMLEGKETVRKRRLVRKPLKDDMKVDEDHLQQLAFLAVKEAAGISSNDLMTLESHSVYSLSKEKTKARFYIMQCAESLKEGLRVPLEEAAKSLQGPLVKKSSSGWVVTPMVEYYDLLPYATILLEWLPRGMLSNNLQDLWVDLGTVDVKKSHDTENPCAKVASTGAEKPNESDKASHGDNESQKQKDDNGCPTIGVSNRVHEPLNINKADSSLACPLNGDNKNSGCEGSMVDSKMDGEKPISAGISFDQECMPIREHTQVPLQLSSGYLEKLQNALASKENALTETALKVLTLKRQRLANQLRYLEDDIALCDKNIQTILDGGEDDLALKIDAVIDGCDDVSLKNTTKSQDHHLERHGFAGNVKRKRLFDAVLTLQNPCQELDDICHRNNWILPTYHVSPANGGFLASIIVEGMEFEFAGKSEIHPSPSQARDSAAAKMIAKLRNTARQN